MISTVTEIEIANGIKDEFGAIYSRDGKRLLRGPNVISYRIKYGTNVICDDAFYESFHLQSIIIPDSVTIIGNYAFSYCRNLIFIEMSNAITYIGNACFTDCDKLKSIVIPQTVTHIGTNPFSGSGIHVIENHSPYFISDGKALYSNQMHELISFYGDCSGFLIPNSVNKIKENAFCYNESLQSIIIPTSVKSIETCAFFRCESLQFITIPSSVTSIGDSAFGLCNNLLLVVFSDTVTHIGSCVFYCCHNLISIIIPRGTMDEFRRSLRDEYHKLEEKNLQ